MDTTVDIKLFLVELRTTSVYCYWPEYKKEWDKAKALADKFPHYNLIPLKDPVYKLKEDGSVEEDADGDPVYVYHRYNIWEAEKPIWLTGEELLEVVSNVEYVVKQTCTKSLNIAEALSRMADKSVLQITSPESHTYNNRVDVHMPGMALSTYNQVMLMEDACSDAVQNELSAGWRIVAVCPQPDQRRPDYILGRFNPDYSPGVEAERGN